MSTCGALSTCLFLFIIKHCTLFYVKGKRSGKRALNLLVLVVILSTNLCQLFVYIFQLFVYKNQLIFSCLFTKVSWFSAVCLQNQLFVYKKSAVCLQNQLFFTEIYVIVAKRWWKLGPKFRIFGNTGCSIKNGTFFKKKAPFLLKKYHFLWITLYFSAKISWFSKNTGCSIRNGTF